MHSIQSIFDQQQDNSIRLANYRAQLTAEQRIRAEVADKVKRYCTQFDLSIKQSLSAIGIALNLIDVGCTADQAYKTGANAARILALVSTGQKLSSITRRKINILH